jgi:hypothetical protein
MKNQFNFLILFIFANLILSCTHYVSFGKEPSVPEVKNLEKKMIELDGFNLTTYSRVTNPSSNIRIYIEGDGNAWITPTQPSNDPTPKYALMLKLAELDHSPNVVYLARPCQFSRSSSPKCSIDYWTDKRFSVDVLRVMNNAMNRFKVEGNKQKLELIGYSGGAAIAAILSARRKDVANLRTIAGNLDHEYVNKYHHVSQLDGSVNPMSYAFNLTQLPQIHFIAENDEIVPGEVAKNFISAQNGECANYVMIKNTTHTEGWEDVWLKLLNAPVKCAD